MKRKPYEVFAKEAYERLKWDKEETEQHPVYQHYFNEDGSWKELEASALYDPFPNGTPIPDQYAYEPKILSEAEWKKRERELKRIKKAWLASLFNGRKRTTPDEFQLTAFKLGWDKKLVERHPLFLKYFNTG